MEMNEQLTRDYSANEVLLAFKQMNPTKALGLDGMAPLFYQKFQKLLGLRIFEAMLDALHTSTFPRELNHTHVKLIPKKKTLEMVSDYRSISLCNVVYKFLSKVLVNRNFFASVNPILRVFLCVDGL